jgi:hypothetical protein
MAGKRWSALTADEKADRLKDMLDDIVNQQNGVNGRFDQRIKGLESIVELIREFAKRYGTGDPPNKK